MPTPNPPLIAKEILDKLVSAYDEWELALPSDARGALGPIVEAAREYVRQGNHGMVRGEALVDGLYYGGRCRNATTARWDAPHRRFVYWRSKFGERWLEAIRWAGEETDPHRDAFKPDAVRAEGLIPQDQRIPIDGSTAILNI